MKLERHLTETFKLTDIFSFWAIFFNRIGDLLHHHGVQCRWPRGSNKQLSSIDPEEYFDSIVEANDILLERVVCTPATHS